MKQMITRILTIALACIAVLFAGCAKPVFTMSENTETKMVITADNARRNDYFAVGTLVVKDGESITYTSALSRGEIKIELIGYQAGASAEEVPVLDDTVLVSFGASGNKTETLTAAPGEYMLKATCRSQATGTVTIEVISSN